MTQWNNEEIDWFIENYPKVGKRFCMDKLNKTEPQIRSRAYRLGLKQNKNSDFFKEWQRKAATGKVGKKRPEHSALMKEYYKNGVISLKDNTIHSLSNHPLYNIWMGMNYRCYNEKSHNYKYYGGRGIQVCEEWRNDLKAFIKWGQKNERPSLEYTLDRIDNNGDYSPDNCRWATASQQSRNKRTNVLTEETARMVRTLHAELGNQREVGRRLGIDYRNVHFVIKGNTWKDV